jgi:hypothetical protein
MAYRPSSISDFRWARKEKYTFGRTRVLGIFDIFNALNASPILSDNTRYGASWLQPTEILAARIVKFGAQLTF